MKFFYTLLILTITNFIFAQSSSISGTIIDDSNGRTLIGVNIVIKELNLKTSSDSEGKFAFKKVPVGSYEISFTSLGYQPKLISEVIVAANENTNLNVTLVEKRNDLAEIVITKTRAKVESVKSLLLMQKNSVSVSDGISAETIKRTPDKNTSDVLKRISGASIQDNKFVIIRGLNDRYNAALLNGAPLPSSEPDRKAFSFDIFPSNMLDNLIITKTASPDLPGEFAGGVVQINTKSVPDKNFQAISVSSGFNTITTFKEQRTYKGSGTDWLGFDNGVRDLPSTVPSTEVFGTLTAPQKAAIAKSFSYDWNINSARFKPNTNFQYSVGHHIDFGDKVFGVMFSVSNNVSRTYAETNRNEYDNGSATLPSVLITKNFDKSYTEQVLTGALANFSFKFNENHSINFKNILSVNSTDLVLERAGQKIDDAPRTLNRDVRWFTTNRIYSGQFTGDHYFTAPKIKLTWTAFYSDIARSIPNLRTNLYSTGDPNSTNPDENTPRAIITANNGGPDYGGGMFFSENTENISGAKIDLSRKFNIGKNLVNEFKMGAFTQTRSRDFFARQLQYNTSANFKDDLLTQTNATIFSIQNMGEITPGVNGFTLFEATKFTDAYKAASKLNAGYAMLDNRLGDFRLVWGFRFENFVQTLDARETEFKYLKLNNKQNDFLPSLNLIYALSKKQNLRFSFSKTLNRPEFRELAPFGFYDFTTQFFTQGNPDLKIAKIDNYDFRYEFYPGKGQIFSFSYFKKNFKNPIEIIQTVNNKEITYENADSGKISGIELEFRTLLSSIFTSEKTTVFDDLTLFSNLAIIKSSVDVSNIASANPEKSRPLQGQSPYVFNGGLQYLNKDNGWGISTNVNRVGNRIFILGSEVEPSIWEKARTFLDVQVSKNCFKNKLEIKLNAQNILAQDLIFYQNNYRNTTSYGSFATLANTIFTGDYRNEKGYSAKDDDLLWKTKLGTTFSLSLTYNF